MHRRSPWPDPRGSVNSGDISDDAKEHPRYDTDSSADIRRWARAGPQPPLDAMASTIAESSAVPLPTRDADAAAAAAAADDDDRPDDDTGGPISRAETTIASSADAACVRVSPSSEFSRLHNIMIPPVDTNRVTNGSYLDDDDDDDDDDDVPVPVVPADDQEGEHAARRRSSAMR